ncbi:MAG: hypothetical protein GY816_15560, partial [Cytophagales bacterium]|nr:hypothetical protein [Cytophagales bacterium]
LSLDPQTTQQQLNRLGQFCRNWGIEINEIKTKVVIFGKQFSNCPSATHFCIDNNPLEVVDRYCYLGIVLHCTGDMKIAQINLKTKAIRAFYGLKRVIMRSKLSFNALTSLFDSLIKPIILYGAPIWAPNSSLNKIITKSITNPQKNVRNLLRNVSGSPQEKVHLSFLKWALGVHRKASNVGVWGETGRLPLIYESIRLTLNYLKRISVHNPKSFISAALREQESMNLPWYK